MHIGEKIRLARVSRHMTQQQLAEKIHKERPLISHIERTGKVHHDTFTAICKALKITADELESGFGDPAAGYGSVAAREIQALKAENERLRTEVKLKDELVQVLKAHIKAISGRRRGK